MSDSIFMKVFVSLVSLFIILIIGSIIFALINKLKIPGLLYILVFILAIGYSFFMSLFISSNMKTKEIVIRGINNKELMINTLVEKNYEVIKSEDNVLVFKLNTFPNYIYNDIKLDIEIDEENNLMKIRTPLYLVRTLQKVKHK